MNAICIVNALVILSFRTLLHRFNTFLHQCHVRLSIVPGTKELTAVQVYAYRLRGSRTHSNGLVRPLKLPSPLWFYFGARDYTGDLGRCDENRNLTVLKYLPIHHQIGFYHRSADGLTLENLSNKHLEISVVGIVFTAVLYDYLST
jgi:hypothetical protein